MLSARPWSAGAVFQFCTAQVLCLFLGLTLAALLGKCDVAGFSQPEAFGNVFLVTMSFQGAAWVLIGIFLNHHEMSWRAAFGLQDPKLARSLLVAVAVGISILPVALLLRHWSAELLEIAGWPPEDEAAVRLLAGASSTWLRVYLGLFAVVLAPVAEEFIFRGMLYPFVKQLGRPRLALIGVNLLFAAIHLNAAALVPLFILALAFTWLYEHTDNLLAPIVAHSLFNTANLIIFLSQE
jgi:membrane protease YdiL (CAAX protease family)